MRATHKMVRISTFLLAALAVYGCKVEPESIDYGEDACKFCQMKIVDARYAAETVTGKGKVYKFDAVECLVNHHRKELGDAEIAHQVINTFDDPSTLHDAQECLFLRTPELPSPMGMYITGFKDHQKASTFLDEHGGELYTWEQLLTEFDRLPVLAEEIRQ